MTTNMIEYKWQRIQLILRIQQQWDWDNDQYQEYQRRWIYSSTNTINITNTMCGMTNTMRQIWQWIQGWIQWIYQYNEFDDKYNE